MPPAPRSRRLPAVLAGLLLLGGGAQLGTAAATPSCGAAGPLCPSAKLHVGVATPGLPGDPAAMTAFSSALGVRPDVALSFTAFRYPVNGAGLRALVAGGQLPMLTWEPFDPTRPDEDAYPLRTIAAGGLDGYLRAQAAAIGAAGGPVVLRFAHEMNATWYPWGSGVGGINGVGGNTAADYVAAYRHVHAVFAAAHATNVIWMWSPALTESKAPGDLAALYPGDDVVDWVGVSAYFDQKTDTYARTVAPTMRRLGEVAPTKPVYVAETAVLPGKDRPAMVHDLVRGIVATPRVIGLTWFDIATRQDWRLDSDPPAMAALREDLRTGWFATDAGHVAPAPLLQVAPAVTGPARVGSRLAGSTGTWRTGSATAYAGRWLRCTGPAACVPVGETGPSYAPTAQDLGAALRYEVTASGSAGVTVALSAPTPVVLMTPAAPGAPTVEARDHAVRVVFPAAPVGATHWSLTVGDVVKPLVPVGTRDYWLTGLPDGAPVTLGLSSVAVSPVETLSSPASLGTVVPMPLPFTPYVAVHGTAATLTLPAAPAGANGWLVTVDGVPRTVPPWTRDVEVGPLSAARPHTWAIAATSGSWAGGPGALTPTVSGSLTPLPTPGPPTVQAAGGTVTLALPALPHGATGWRVTVGPKSYPDVAGPKVLVAAGFKPGYAVTWTLKAVTASGSGLVTSEPVTGRATP